jgi:hypothetical protein
LVTTKVAAKARAAIEGWNGSSIGVLGQKLDTAKSRQKGGTMNLKLAVEGCDLAQFFGHKRFGKISPDRCGYRLDFSEGFLLQTLAQSRTPQLPNLG